MNLLLPTDTCGWWCKSETRVLSSRGFVKQYNQELCISSNTCYFIEQESNQELRLLYGLPRAKSRQSIIFN